jgi:hypothetical protein
VIYGLRAPWGPGLGSDRALKLGLLPSNSTGRPPFLLWAFCGFPQALFLVQCDLTYNNKTYGSGEITLSWASNAAYCGPNGLLVDNCEGGIFNWTQEGNCQTLRIYDPKQPDSLIVGLERICTTPIIIYWPNTTYWIPRLSPLRLAGFNYFVPVVDGLTPEGKPRIVDHVLGDIDVEALTQFVVLDRITGPRARDFVGVTVPLGVKFLEPSRARLGFNYISPDQVSFPPFFPFNLFLS